MGSHIAVYHSSRDINISGTGSAATLLFLVVSRCRNCLVPLTFTWPHLRCDVGLEEGEYK